VKPVISSASEKQEIFDALDQGLCVVEVLFDATGKCIDYVFLEVNASFEKQTGLAAAAGKSMRSLRPDHEGHWFDIYGEIARTGSTKRFTAEAAALGRWYDVCAFRIGGPDERKVAILFDDITEKRRAEEHYALLRREIDHRARNLLTLASGLVRISAGETAEAYKANVLARLVALERSQKLLSEGGATATDFSALVLSELEPYRADESSRVHVSGPAVTIDRGQVQCLAMVLHELATNAVKHGSLSAMHGVVSISWIVEDGNLRVTWIESGGSEVRAPARVGVGTKVLTRCMQDLGGNLAPIWDRSGLRCEITIPLRRAVT
jgi:two-component sensor histidine kinase